MNFSDEKCAAFRILAEGVRLASADLFGLATAIRAKALSADYSVEEMIPMHAQCDHASTAAMALGLSYALLNNYLNLWSEPIAKGEGGEF